jgi:hypothetical protein
MKAKLLAAVAAVVMSWTGQAQAATIYTTLTGTSGDLPVHILLTADTWEPYPRRNYFHNGNLVQIKDGIRAVYTQAVEIGEKSYFMSPWDESEIKVGSYRGSQSWWGQAIPYSPMQLSFRSPQLPTSLLDPFETISVTGSGKFECRSCVLDQAGQIVAMSYAFGSFTINTASMSLTPPAPSPVPLPAAASMLASALGIGGLIGWRRKRRAMA